MDTKRRLITVSIVLVIVFLFGTIGYQVIEKWGMLDAFYMTLITLTTIGYAEVHTLSPQGRLFTIVLIFAGLGSALYAASTATQFIVEGELNNIFRRRKMDRRIQALRDHYIVCGFGRIGATIVQELAKKSLPVVVVEKDPQRVLQLKETGHVFIEADATLDSGLIKAGVQRAKALSAVVSSDADNLMITLSARNLNKDLFIVSRLMDEANEQKFLRVGANKVVSPYFIGGHRMAQVLLRPSVVDFIDLATKAENLELQIEEIRIANQPGLVNKTLKDSALRQDYGIIVVAVRRGDGVMLFNPPSETILKSGDLIIALGRPEHLSKILEKKDEG
jgi:voltage-gated potassium channel